MCDMPIIERYKHLAQADIIVTKTRINPYRQPKRKSDQTLGVAALLTIGLMTVGYFALKPTLDTSMVEEVIASNGARTLAQVQTGRLIEASPFIMTGFVILWFMLAFVIRRRSQTDFDGASADQAAVPAERVVRMIDGHDLQRISPKESDDSHDTT